MAIMREIDAEVTLFTATEDDEIVVQPTEIEYATSRYDTAAELSITGVPEVENSVISKYPEASSEPTTAVCRATASAEPGNDSAVGPILASGKLEDGSINEDGLWTGTVIDAVRTLRQSIFNGQYGSIPTTDLVQIILESAGISEHQASPNDPEGRPSYVVNTPEQAYPTTKEFNNTPSFEALDEVLESWNWWWWCTADNTIWVDIDLPTREVELPYIIETSAGKQTPPWQAVEVIGERVPEGARPGDSTSGEHVIGKGSEIRATSGNGRPVFTEVNREIETEEQAQALADSIFSELLAQQKGGTITALGNPELRPFDIVRLPDHMGGEAYLASAITHTISDSDGYVMEIECGGLMDPGEGGEETTETPTDGQGGGLEGLDPDQNPSTPEGVQ